MKLTKVERWILSNQYRILEKLYPQEAKSLQRIQEILENGYEQDYDLITRYIYDGDDTMSESECNEVLEILSMFDELAYGYKHLSAKDKKKISKTEITFSGFDGNDSTELKYLAYARFLNKGDGKSFSKDTGLFNSHCLMLDVYRRMLADWKKSEHKNQLKKDDIKRILAARVHPSNRK